VNVTDAWQEIESIKNQLITKYKAEKIILFGSAAAGIADINDIDLLVVKQDTPHFGIDRMREVDNILERNIAVDILIYRPAEIAERLKTGDPFILKIFQEGKVLYG
jgi:predicted nucleotidyltransferase